MNISSKSIFVFSSETHPPVLRVLDVPKHAFDSYRMLSVRVVIVPAENSESICNIRPSGGHGVYNSSDSRLVYGRIAGFFVGLPLVKVHCHWCGNWPGLRQSELRKDRPNVAVLMDVDRVMHSIEFDLQAGIDGDTPEIMQPDHFVHLMHDLPNEALYSNDVGIIDVQNDCGNDVLILIMEHKQSSVDT
jgi:hypothetical protein